MNRTHDAVLGLLAEGPKSGYEICKVFEERIGQFWRESLGQIYPSLAAFEKEGLVRKDDDPAGQRTRDHNRITRTGQKALRAWLEMPSKLQQRWT